MYKYGWAPSLVNNPYISEYISVCMLYYVNSGWNEILWVWQEHLWHSNHQQVVTASHISLWLQPIFASISRSFLCCGSQFSFCSTSSPIYASHIAFCSTGSLVQEYHTDRKCLYSILNHFLSFISMILFYIIFPATKTSLSPSLKGWKLFSVTTVVIQKHSIANPAFADLQCLLSWIFFKWWRSDWKGGRYRSQEGR